jgi:hypothetical protein
MKQSEWAENVFGTGEPEGLRRVAQMTWQLDRQDASPAQLAAFLDDLYLTGGRYLIYKGRHISAESVHQARKSFEQNTLQAVENPHGLYSRAYASSAGWHLGDYIHAVGLVRDERCFEVLPVDERILTNRELREAFIDGFRDQVHSRYDEDEERFPGSEHSRAQEKKRESFCQSFEAHLAQKSCQLSQPAREKVLDRTAERMPQEGELQRIMAGEREWIGTITTKGQFRYAALSAFHDGGLGWPDAVKRARAIIPQLQQ